jgi:DNA-binding response OmpR family regulator
MESQQKKTILIAEDDDGIIEVMKIILEQEGYEITTAHTKHEVQQSVKKVVPDLIFLDIRLGGDSGEEIGSELRSDSRSRKVPLIILSADSEAETIALKIRADGFLLKPFDIESLVTTVKAHIR